MISRTSQDVFRVRSKDLADHIDNFGKPSPGKSRLSEAEIDLKPVLENVFESGPGVVHLSAHMSDQQILSLIKGACKWSEGKAFLVIPPQPH